MVNGVLGMPCARVNHGKTQGRRGLNALFRKQQSALTSSHWQVIQSLSSMYLNFLVSTILVLNPVTVLR